MIKRFVRLSLLLFILGFLSSCNKSLLTLFRGKIASETFSKQTLSSQSTFGFTIIPVEINGEIHNFMFDSGAEVTLITEQLANEINLSDAGEINITDSQGAKGKMRYGVIDSLFLGNILFSQIGAVIMNTGLVHYFSCMNVDGIIGMNMIRLCNWKIDYNNDKFVFQSVDSSFQQANAQKIPFEIMRGVPKVAWYVNGKKYSFTIDTGKNGIEIGVPELPQSAVIFRKTIGYNSFGLHGISQNDTTRSFLCDISDSLGFSLKNIAFEQSPSTQTLIGTGFFKKYFSSISLDFKSKYLLAEPINSVSKQITVYAFTPMQKEKHLLVGSVEVSESKISVGDTILQINEVSIEKVGICAALTNYMQHLKSEKTIDLTYLHKGEVVKSRFECSLLFGASKNE